MENYSEKTSRVEGFLLKAGQGLRHPHGGWGTWSDTRWKQGFSLNRLGRILAKPGLSRSGKDRMDTEGQGWGLVEKRAQGSLTTVWSGENRCHPLSAGQDLHPPVLANSRANVDLSEDLCLQMTLSFWFGPHVHLETNHHV